MSKLLLLFVISALALIQVSVVECESAPPFAPKELATARGFGR